MIRYILIIGGLLMMPLNGMIPREKLFKPAEIVVVKISPQTHQKGYLKCEPDGTMNLFVGERQLTFFQEPAIHRFLWTEDEKTILFVKDVGGSRDYHVMGVDVETAKITDYTQGFDRVLGKIYGLVGSKAILGIAGKNPLYHDVYSLDLKRGELTLAYSNERFAKFWFDEKGHIALKAEVHPEGAMIYFDAENHVFLDLSPQDAFHTTPLKVYEGKCYLLDTRTSDTTALICVDLKTRETKTLAHALKSDIQEVIFEKGQPIAYSLCFTHTSWHALTPEVKETLRILEETIGTEFNVMSQEGDHWIVRSHLPTQGIELFHYDRKAHSIKKLSHYPLVEKLLPMHPLVIPARDGKELVCYLTLPEEVKGPLPLVITPHGGPFQVRDTYAYDAEHQWLASRGYAALNVNYRSSSGFGKSFVCAGNGEWGGKAQEDLIDAAEWCVQKGVAQREKIAIYGGSYGGYAGLAGLTFTPDYFVGAVAICGPSNLKTVLDAVPLYWESPTYRGSDSTVFFTKGAFVANMGGNPDKEEEAPFLHSRSPLNAIHAITKPLLLIHGSNDPIVAQSESDQIYEAMKAKGLPLTYLVFPDEGHGFSKFPNQIVGLAYAEKFLADLLGGTYEEIHPKDQEASSLILNR